MHFSLDDARYGAGDPNTSSTIRKPRPFRGGVAGVTANPGIDLGEKDGWVGGSRCEGREVPDRMGSIRGEFEG
jgi:hypothetical protein